MPLLKTKKAVPIPSSFLNVLNFLGSFGSLFNRAFEAWNGGQRNEHEQGALLLFLRVSMFDKQDELRTLVSPTQGSV